MEKKKIIIIVSSLVVVSTVVGYFLWKNGKEGGGSASVGGTVASDPAAPSNVGSPIAVKTASDAKTYLVTSAGDKYPVANQSDFKKITGHNTWDYKIHILSDAEINTMKTVTTYS